MQRSSTTPGSQLATSAAVEITRKKISPTYFLGEIDFRLLQSWPLAWFLYTESYANQQHGITFTCPMFPDMPSGQQMNHLSGKTLNIEQRTRLADGYLAYLSNKKPEYFVTLTYRQPHSDRAAEMGMRGFVLKLLNRLPKRIRQNFGGLVCAERHTDARFEGTYHFHFLLWGMDGVMTEPFAWLQEQVIKGCVRATSKASRSELRLCGSGEEGAPQDLQGRAELSWTKAIRPPLGQCPTS